METAKRGYATLGAVIAWGALALQCYITLGAFLAAGQGIAAGLTKYFSFFTILTNLLVAIVLTAVALGQGEDRFFRRPFVKTGGAVCITLVGLVYFFFLRQQWDPQGAQLVADIVLHYVMPVLYVVYWLLFVRKQPLEWTHPFLWIAYPLGYFLYALLLGARTGEYPYYFIDAGTLGYGRVLVNALLVTAAFLVLGCAFVAIAKAQTSRRV